MTRDTPTLGLRELKKRQTRFQLSAAARGLVLRDGLDVVTVDDIVKAAGVSPRTFFNYYETKMDAVIGPFDDEPGTAETRAVFAAGGPTGVLLDDVAQLVAPDRLEYELREHISQVATLCKLDPRVLAAFVAAGAKQEAAVAELLRERLGDGASPHYVALAAGIITTIASRAALAWAGDTTGSLEDAFREHCAMAAELFDTSRAENQQRRSGG